MRSDSEMVNLRSVIETLCYMVDEDSDGVEEIMQLPSIDLVRCEECKHKEVCFSEVAMTNKYQTSTIYERIDFCSYGCRKESE